MTDTTADAGIARLPGATGSPRSPHRFGDPVSVPANPALGRHPQTERTCTLCGVVKVTVHGADGKHWREWRSGASAAQIETDMPFPCELKLDAEAFRKP